MATTIRDASSFIIGGALLRQAAMTQSKVPVSFDEVAGSALLPGEVGARMRSAISAAASEHGAGILRNTPSHRLKTQQVMTSRIREVESLNGIIAAAIIAAEHGESALKGDKSAHVILQQSLVSALHTIVDAPGSESTDKRKMYELLAQEVAMHCNGNLEWVQEEINEASRVMLQEKFDAIYDNYDPSVGQRSERGDDLSL